MNVEGCGSAFIKPLQRQHSAQKLSILQASIKRSENRGQFAILRAARPEAITGKFAAVEPTCSLFSAQSVSSHR